MVKITYVDRSGESLSLNLPEGWNLMQGAVLNGVDGIVGECGGSLVCATCHCYIDEPRLADLPPPSAEELEMLGSVAAEKRANSRLACQVKVTPSLEGLVITVPETQE